MGIPIGQTYTATMTGQMLKSCLCERCGAEYLYKAQRQAAGSGTSLLWLDNHGASSRAEEEARQALQKALAGAVDPVACPGCGWFQKAMVKLLKRQKIGTFVVPPLLAAVGLFVLWFCWGEANGSSWMMPSCKALLVLGPILGLLGYLIHDPNARVGNPDVGRRRASGSRGVLRQRVEREHAERMAALSANLNTTLRLAMVTMAAADGEIDASELEAIAAIYEKFAEERLDLEVLRQEAAGALDRSHVLRARLAALAPHLDKGGKSLFLKALLLVATADGVFSPAERDLVKQVAEALLLSAPELEELLAA